MIDERLFVAYVFQDRFGAPVAGHLHDFVDPCVVDRRAGYESGPQRVPGILARIETNSPGMALYDSCNVAGIKRASRCDTAAQQRLEDESLADSRCLQPAFQMRDRLDGFALNNRYPLSGPLRVRLRPPYVNHYSLRALAFEVFRQHMAQLRPPERRREPEGQDCCVPKPV